MNYKALKNTKNFIYGFFIRFFWLAKRASEVLQSPKSFEMRPLHPVGVGEKTPCDILGSHLCGFLGQSLVVVEESCLHKPDPYLAEEARAEMFGDGILKGEGIAVLLLFHNFGLGDVVGRVLRQNNGVNVNYGSNIAVDVDG